MHFFVAKFKLVSQLYGACVFCTASAVLFYFKEDKIVACFLIDYENESERMLEGISIVSLTENDEIIIFYSKRVGRISMEMHQRLEKIPAKKTYIKVETNSSNALDFQLVTYLGACIHNKPTREYYIISRDTDFDCVCKFWANYNVFVKRINQFCNYADIKKTP